MWVEELKNGKFKFVERYTEYITGKTKKISVVMDKNTSSSRKLAQEELSKKINTANMLVTKSNITLHELAEKYITYQKKVVKISTYRRNYYSINSIQNILGSDILVDNLTTSYILNKFLETGKEPGTINEQIKRFKAMINWGYKNDYLQDISYISKLDYFKDISQREKIKDKYLELYEIKALLNIMSTNNMWHWYYLTNFLLLSGLRIGEAVALTTDDVDTVNRVIIVNKTYDPNNKVTTVPKTLCSIREVYIQDELLSLVKLINIYTKEIKLLNAASNNYFFVSPNGNKAEYYAYSKYLKETSISVLDRQITIHALRHTHASLLLAEGISIDTISRRLGHENSKVTREIYLHVTNKLINADNNSIKKIKII